MARLAKGLEKLPGISSVETSLHTGSLIVHHKKELGDIRPALTDLGVIMIAATGVEMRAHPLAQAIADLDRRLGPFARGFPDLKLLVPLGFGALAVIQLLRRGLQFEGAPWYILAFFAIESFTRLNMADEKRKPAPQESTR
jgi:hypothetical protein